MKRYYLLILFIWFAITASAQTAEPGAINRHIQIATYNPNQVYLVHTMQGYITTIQFSADEKITAVNIGDSSSWLVSVQDYTLNLKPTSEQPDTNLNVLTTRGTYQFFLTAPPLQTDSAGKLSRQPQANTIFLLRFEYPNDSNANAGNNSIYSLKNLPRLPTKEVVENWKYTARGDANTAPIKVFDNGFFTFFDFGKRKDIPAIFSVDASGRESMVNYHVQGKYVVVETTSRQFTLRNGNQVATVFNEAPLL